MTANLTAIWLTPWYRSPTADGGYDVADYRDIDPLFGTLRDAEALIAEAHEHHLRIIIDIVPTILEAVGVEAPLIINGASQRPIEGVSILYSLNNSKAPSTRRTQYFELAANRALYHDGWIACTTPKRPPWVNVGGSTKNPADDYEWELYDLNKDFTQADNLAKTHPKKLRELQDLWWAEAAKFNVLPLDSRGQMRFLDERPGPAPRNEYVYLPRGDEIPNWTAVDPLNRSFSVTAEATVPEKGAEGVLMAQGGRFGGYSLFVKDKKFHFAYNLCGLEEHKIVSDVDVPAGKVTFKVDFKKVPKDDEGALGGFVGR